MSVGVACPECGHAESNVTDSRPSGATMRRRRRCCACAHRFTTYELSHQELEAEAKRRVSHRLRDLRPTLESLVAQIEEAAA